MYNIDSIIALWQTEAQHPGEINQELDTALTLPIILGCTPDGLPYIMLLAVATSQAAATARSHRYTGRSTGKCPAERKMVTRIRASRLDSCPCIR